MKKIIKRILGGFKKPSPIKDEINRRDQHLRGNVKPLYDHKLVRKLRDHIQALKFENKNVPKIPNATRIALACDISEWILEEYGIHITEEDLIEQSPNSTADQALEDDPITRYTEKGQDIFEYIYSEIEMRILRYFKEVS